VNDDTLLLRDRRVMTADNFIVRLDDCSSCIGRKCELYSCTNDTEEVNKS